MTDDLVDLIRFCPAPVLPIMSSGGHAKQALASHSLVPRWSPVVGRSGSFPVASDPKGVVWPQSVDRIGLRAPTEVEREMTAKEARSRSRDASGVFGSLAPAPTGCLFLDFGRKNGIGYLER